MKKIICLISVCLLILSCFTCCSKKDPDTETTVQETTQEETTVQQTVVERDITIGYYEGKSLNPFKTDSLINLNLSTLFYDPLFVCDDSYEAEPVIAASFTNKGRKLTVELDPDAQFSKGNQVTPRDVVYSFNLAKKSVFYQNRLSGISYAVEGESQVTFILTKPDVFAQNCLNFPIVKHSTGNNALPTGSGRYVVRKDGDGFVLVANESSTHGEVMSTEKIRLTPVNASEGELYMLQTGDISYFYEDLSEGEATKIGANMVHVPLNNLVYLGMNNKSEALKDKNVVAAIEYALDKTTIADAAYRGMCRTADCVFNPDWVQLKNITVTPHEYSTVKAEEILEDSEYVYVYENVHRSKNFKFLELTLIVNNENQAKVKCADIIADRLKSIGVKLTTLKLTYEEYIEALENSEFDLYVGEVKLSPNMNLSCFFTPGGAASYGIDTESTVAKASEDLASGNVDVNTFIQVFNENKPFIPICYRDGIAYFSREITFEGTVSEYEPFKNIYSWEIGENQPGQPEEPVTEETENAQK